jgi:Tol biopolymer transport system component
MKAVVIVIALALAGCTANRGSPASGGAPPGGPSAPSAAQSVDASKVPPGRIAYMRVDPDKVERYFIVDSDGKNEHSLFETEGCACIRWSADGSEIWTVTETETALAYTTQDPDGGDRVVHVPDIPTLSLAPGYGSADGRHVAFFGWDDTDPTRVGLWTANTDLTDLHKVTPVPDGVLGLDPIGMSANGSHIYFHGDLGENKDNGFHHAGNVYVIAADGTGLRQLNPEGTKTEITGTGLSADGRRFAFTAWRGGHGADGNALFIVDDIDGEAVQVTDFGDRWGASWSPNGAWIGYSTSGNDAALISLIKPDGTGATAVTPKDLSEDITMPAWSPDGSHLLVRRGERQSNDLWIIDLEGTFVWQVTHKPAAYDIYAWAPAPPG